MIPNKQLYLKVEKLEIYIYWFIPEELHTYSRIKVLILCHLSKEMKIFVLTDL